MSSIINSPNTPPPPPNLSPSQALNRKIIYWSTFSIEGSGKNRMVRPSIGVGEKIPFAKFMELASQLNEQHSELTDEGCLHLNTKYLKLINQKLNLATEQAQEIPPLTSQEDFKCESEGIPIARSTTAKTELTDSFGDFDKINPIWISIESIKPLEDSEKIDLTWISKKSTISC